MQNKKLETVSVKMRPYVVSETKQRIRRALDVYVIAAGRTDSTDLTASALHAVESLWGDSADYDEKHICW